MSPTPPGRLEGAEWIGSNARTYTPRQASALNCGVLHLTDVVAASMRSMALRHANPPHTWWDRRDREHLQTVRLDHAARALLAVSGVETNHRGYTFQVECHDKAQRADTYNDDDLAALATDVIVPISRTHGLGFVAFDDAKRGSESYGRNAPNRMSRTEWNTRVSRDGLHWHWCRHVDIYGQNHWDGPFDMARLMDIAAEIDNDPNRWIIARPVLGLGDIGEDVRQLKRMLNMWFAESLDEDSDSFDQHTHEAVVRAQEDIGTIADGLWGPKSKAAFEQWTKEIGESIIDGITPKPEPEPPVVVITPDPEPDPEPAPEPEHVDEVVAELEARVAELELAVTAHEQTLRTITADARTIATNAEAIIEAATQ